MFLIALLHEAGHLLAAKILGYSVHGIKIQPFGVSLDLSGQKIKGYHEIIIGISGPIVNIILLVAGVIIVKYGHYCSELFFVSNFYMLIINLMPVLPLDGGRILKSLFESETNSKKNERVFKCISLVSVLVMLIAGIIFLVKTKQNLSLLLISLFLLDSVRPYNNRSNGVADIFLSEIKNGRAKVYYIGEKTLVKDALKLMSYDDVNIAFVLDCDGKIIGAVSNKYILRLISEGKGKKEISSIVNSG